MKLRFKYHLLICVLIFNSLSLVAMQLQEKQVDSILEAAGNSAYENPDETISIALSIYNNTSYSLNIRARSLITLCLGYNSKRDYKTALDYIIKANELVYLTDDKNLQIRILFVTGLQYQQLKIYDKAIDYMDEVEKEFLISSEPRDSVRDLLANSYLVKGFIYKDNLNCDIALEFFNKALNELDRIGGHYHNRSIGYYNKGNCYIALSEYIKAKESFNQSIQFAKRKNANSLVAFAEKGMAEVYSLEGKYEEAILLLESAHNKSKDVGDLILNSGIYKGLFENNLALNKWDEYEKYYKLFSKTQLEIKTSERNSISVSLKENSNNLNEELNHIQSKFKRAFNLIVVVLFLFIIVVFIFEIKNKKTIKELQKKIENTQKSNPITESK